MSESLNYFTTCILQSLWNWGIFESVMGPLYFLELTAYQTTKIRNLVPFPQQYWEQIFNIIYEFKISLQWENHHGHIPFTGHTL